jgi:molybdopterin synthase catalytic subunit
MHRVIQVQQQDFDLAEQYQKTRQHCGEAAGAIVAFAGLVRDHNVHAGDGGRVGTLALEHYPGMTESSISQILDEAEARWPLLATTVIHRVGELHPTDQIVLVVVASAHRSAAFAAAEFLMDYLKTRAIFWKKETSDQGVRWIESTLADQQRASTWADSGAVVDSGQK